MFKRQYVLFIQKIHFSIFKIINFLLLQVPEEIPPFPEKESSGLLNPLEKKRPGVHSQDDPGDRHLLRDSAFPLV